MSQTQERETAQPPLARTEEAIDHLGKNIGSFAGVTLHRLQHTATHMKTEVVATPQPVEGPSEQPRPEEVSPTMQQAEKLVDDMGHNLAHLTAATGRQARKLVAYAREGIDDIVAEAQYKRLHATGHTNRPQS